MASHDLLWLSDQDFTLVSGDQLVVRNVSFRQECSLMTRGSEHIRMTDPPCWIVARAIFQFPLEP